jgi:uncharacterized protein YbjQ (UPF0145 family)
MSSLLLILILLIVGHTTGSYFEKKHLHSLAIREQKNLKFMTTSLKLKGFMPENHIGHLASGSVVIGSDYFKTFAAKIRGIFGGNIKSYETLFERGRREAILRMQENAIKWGATQIINVRIETSTINKTNSSDKGLPMVEMFAYGTALKPIQ